MKETNISISEIILQCGYKNQNHFYTMFKKYCGKTPAQYRKEIYLDKAFQNGNIKIKKKVCKRLKKCYNQKKIYR